MKDNTLYVTIGSKSYEDGDYRCGGTVTDYYKEYRCCKCRKVISTKFSPSAKFCSNCSAELNGKVEDVYLTAGKKRIAAAKRRKTNILKTVNGDNYYKVSEQIAELDKEIEYTEEAINNWRRFNYSGSLPTGYELLKK